MNGNRSWVVRGLALASAIAIGGCAADTTEDAPADGEPEQVGTTEQHFLVDSYHFGCFNVAWYVAGVPLMGGIVRNHYDVYNNCSGSRHVKVDLVGTTDTGCVTVPRNDMRTATKYTFYDPNHNYARPRGIKNC